MSEWRGQLINTTVCPDSHWTTAAGIYESPCKLPPLSAAVAAPVCSPAAGALLSCRPRLAPLTARVSQHTCRTWQQWQQWRHRGQGGVATRATRTRGACGHLCAGAGAAVVASPAFSSSVPLVEITLLPSTRSSVSLFRWRPYLHTSSFALPF